MDDKLVHLKNINKKSAPFKVDKNYFASKNHKLYIETFKPNFQRVKLLSKKNIFKPPVSYFDHFPAQMIKKVNEKPISAISQTKFNFKPSPRSIFTSIFALIFISILLWFSIPERQTLLQDDKLAEVSKTEMFSYLATENITPEDILGKNDLSLAESDSLIINAMKYSNKEINDFLEEYNEDYEVLLKK